MPVLATMTAIALLRSRDGAPDPFFDPEELRKLLYDGLDGMADAPLHDSLAMVDELEAALLDYRVSVEYSMDSYVQESSNPDSDSSDLIERLAPLDRDRASLLQAIIGTRQRLLSLLGNERWDAVFNV